MRKKRPILFSQLDAYEDAGSYAEQLVDDTPTPDVLFESAEQAESLRRSLLLLPIMQREVLHLYYGEEMTSKEIAEMLHKPIDTIKSQHLRAIRTLRNMLDAPK
jgi:RNA polymerase sigma-70 factor (ECF subfamily)